VTALRKTLIRRAREIIRDPTCWTQTTAARDQLWQAVSPRSDKARMFCAYGALAKAAHEQELSDRSLVELFDPPTLSQLIRINDSRHLPAVLAFLEQLEKES
jgi:hypothetical protein